MSVDTPSRTASSRCCAPTRRGFSVLELTVVVATLAILVAILLPAVQHARTAARNAQCFNNLRCLALAMREYADVYGGLPPGTTGTGADTVVRFDPAQHHFSWTTRILPQLDQLPAFDAIDFEATMYAEALARIDDNLFATAPSMYLCPQLEHGAAASSYVGFHHDHHKAIGTGDNGLLFLNSFVSPARIADGQSSTLLLSESDSVYPIDWTSGNRATLRAAELLRRRSGVGPAAEPPATLPDVDEVVAPLTAEERLTLELTAGGSFEPSDTGFTVGSRFDRHCNVATAAGEVRSVSRSFDDNLFRSLVNRRDAAPIEGFR